MDKMVDHLFVFEGEGEIKDLLGNYTSHRKHLQQSAKAKKSGDKSTEKIKVSTLDDGNAVVEKKVEEKKVKLSYKEKAEFDTLEKDMEKLEEEKDKLSEILSNPDSSNDDLMNGGKRLSKVMDELETKSDRWLELSEYV